jgi:dienelactone hydrolase
MDDVVKCGVACHPGGLSLGPITFPDCFKNQSKPMLYCMAEIDREIGPQRLKEIEEIVIENSKGKEMNHQEVLFYPGTIHGFAVRGEESNPIVSAARQDALEKQFKFFKKHL